MPVKASIVEELEASLANVMFAEAVLCACGAKVTVNEAVFPAAIVSGNATPVTENSELSAPAEETVTVASVAPVAKSAFHNLRRLPASPAHEVLIHRE